MNDFVTTGYFPVLTTIFNDVERTINETMRTVKTGYPMNIIDLEGNGFELEVALAGFTKDDIQVEVKDSILTIKVEARETKDKVYLRQGISNKGMETSFKLSEKIDVSKITVKFENGLLVVNVPLKKDSETNTRKIKIS